MESIPAEEVNIEIDGVAEEEEEDDELVEVDLGHYEERIAELEAALALEKERSVQLQAKVVELEMQLREALAGGAGAPAPPPPPAAPAAPPPPPAAAAGAPPPPPPAGGPPPPPPPAAGGPVRGGAADPRAGLLNAIEGFSKGKLKKAVTVDKSAPVTKSEPAASSGGGGGGNSIAAMAMAKRGALKSAPGARTKSGRISKEQAEANRSHALNLINLRSTSLAPRAEDASAPSDSPGPTTIDFRAGLKRSAADASAAAAAPAVSSDSSPSPALNVTLRKATTNPAPPEKAAESSPTAPGFGTLRRANTTPLKPAAGEQAPTASQPDFRSGLKTLAGGADKTVSGRYKAPKVATGPAPGGEVNFRANLKRTGPL